MNSRGRTIFLRVSVTIEAPAHLEGCVLIHQRHRIHTPVTGFAADALLYVNTVVEINVIGKIVDLGPLDGLFVR